MSVIVESKKDAFRVWVRGKGKEISIGATTENSPCLAIGYYIITDGKYSKGMPECLIFNKQEEVILQRYDEEKDKYVFIELDPRIVADKFQAFLDDIKTCIK